MKKEPNRFLGALWRRQGGRSARSRRRKAKGYYKQLVDMCKDAGSERPELQHARARRAVDYERGRRAPGQPGARLAATRSARGPRRRAPTRRRGPTSSGRSASECSAPSNAKIRHREHTDLSEDREDQPFHLNCPIPGGGSRTRSDGFCHKAVQITSRRSSQNYEAVTKPRQSWLPWMQSRRECILRHHSQTPRRAPAPRPVSRTSAAVNAVESLAASIRGNA